MTIYLKEEEIVKFFKEMGGDKVYIMYGKVGTNHKKVDKYIYFVPNYCDLKELFVRFPRGRYEHFLEVDEEARTCYLYHRRDRFTVKKVTKNGIEFYNKMYKLISSYDESKSKLKKCSAHISRIIVDCFTTDIFDTEEKREE